jgi:hypothetical protein
LVTLCGRQWHQPAPTMWWCSWSSPNTEQYHQHTFAGLDKKGQKRGNKNPPRCPLDLQICSHIVRGIQVLLVLVHTGVRKHLNSGNVQTYIQIAGRSITLRWPVKPVRWDWRWHRGEGGRYYSPLETHPLVQGVPMVAMVVREESSKAL